jgi:hypothetical protein
VKIPKHFVVISALLLPAAAMAQASASSEPSPAESGAPEAVPEEASPTGGDDKKTLVVLDLEAIDVDSEKLRIINAAVVDQLSSYAALEIISQDDIRQMVDFEADKAAMGCDTNSCLSEIAGAMGAAYVVFGQAGRLDDTIFVQLNLFDSAKARAIGREDVRSQKLSELPDRVVPAVGRLVQPLTGEAPPPEPVFEEGATASGGGSPMLLWGGVAALGLGVVGAGVAGALLLPVEETLGDATSSSAEKDGAKGMGLGLVAGVAVGSVIALTGAGLAGASFLVE